jgi:hypothetical protein
VPRWLESIYTLHGKNLTNTSYTWPPGSHIWQPLVKSLLSQNRVYAPGMKSWLPAMPNPTVILGCLILSPSSRLEEGGTVRQSSYRATRFTGPHKNPTYREWLSSLKCLIVATVLSHSCYSAQPFLLQWSVILENSVISRCYSVKSFLIKCSAIFHWATVLSHFLLQYSVILSRMLSHFSELSHSSCCNAQPF